MMGTISLSFVMMDLGVLEVKLKRNTTWKEYDIKVRVYENNNLKEFYGYGIDEINPVSKAKEIFMVI